MLLCHNIKKVTGKIPGFCATKNVIVYHCLRFGTQTTGPSSLCFRKVAALVVQLESEVAVVAGRCSRP